MSAAQGSIRSREGQAGRSSCGRDTQDAPVERPCAPLDISGSGSGMGPSVARPPERPPHGWKAIVLLCTLAIFICYADRSNITVAIVEMSAQFHWSEEYKGTVLSIFFLGYACTQLLGGSLADRYGGKSVLAFGVTAWSLFTFITPDAAMLGAGALIPCRVAMGLGEGVAFPAIHSIVSIAVPPGRQSTVVAVITAASYAGAAAAAGLAPLIIRDLSWPAVFYIFGASALIWLPVWAFVRVPGPGSSVVRLRSGDENGPQGPPHSEDGVAPDADAGWLDSEVQPLRPHGMDADGEPGPAAASLGDAEPSAHGTMGLILDRGFWALLGRQEVWAICVAQYTMSWGMYVLLNWLPTFFNEQYQIEVGDIGKYTFLPLVLQAVVGGASGFAADVVIGQGFSVKRTRQLLQVAGMMGPAVCLGVAVSPLCNDATDAAAALTIAQGLSALTLAAVSVSHLDVAPRHAGSIFGLGNMIGTGAGFLGTQLTGLILERTHSWMLVFGVASAHWIVGAVCWVRWVGDEPLPEDSLVG